MSHRGPWRPRLAHTASRGALALAIILVAQLWVPSVLAAQGAEAFEAEQVDLLGRFDAQLETLGLNATRGVGSLYVEAARVDVLLERTDSQTYLGPASLQAGDGRTQRQYLHWEHVSMDLDVATEGHVMVLAGDPSTTSPTATGRPIETRVVGTEGRVVPWHAAVAEPRKQEGSLAPLLLLARPALSWQGPHLEATMEGDLLLVVRGHTLFFEHAQGVERIRTGHVPQAHGGIQGLQGGHGSSVVAYIQFTDARLATMLSDAGPGTMVASMATLACEGSLRAHHAGTTAILAGPARLGLGPSASGLDGTWSTHGLAPTTTMAVNPAWALLVLLPITAIAWSRRVSVPRLQRLVRVGRYRKVVRLAPRIYATRHGDQARMAAIVAHLRLGQGRIARQEAGRLVRVSPATKTFMRAHGAALEGQTRLAASLLAKAIGSSPAIRHQAAAVPCLAPLLEPDAEAYA